MEIITYILLATSLASLVILFKQIRKNAETKSELARLAQDEATEEVEDVVVLGVKQSLIDAIELKRSKVGVTEAISERSDIKTFHNWCTKEILDPVSGVSIATNPNCVIEAKDPTGAVGQLNIQKMYLE